MGWLSRKKKTKSTGISNERYKTEPAIYLLEQYVLKCIGELPHEIEQEIVGFHGAEWSYHIRRLLPLPSDLDDKIRFLWRQELPLTADEFAQQVVPYISVERDGIVERPDWAELFQESLNE